MSDLNDPRDERGRQRFWVFSSWQWAVLGSYLVAIILSAIVGVIGKTALDNTTRIDRALCAEIIYLEHPELRRDPATQKLASDLRRLEVRCPAARLPGDRGPVGK